MKKIATITLLEHHFRHPIDVYNFDYIIRLEDEDYSVESHIKADDIDDKDKRRSALLMGITEVLIKHQYKQ